jgi:hypothetical protein
MYGAKKIYGNRKVQRQKVSVNLLSKISQAPRKFLCCCAYMYEIAWKMGGGVGSRSRTEPEFLNIYWRLKSRLFP